MAGVHATATMKSRQQRQTISSSLTGLGDFARPRTTPDMRNRIAAKKRKGRIAGVELMLRLHFRWGYTPLWKITLQPIFDNQQHNRKDAAKMTFAPAR